MTNAIERERPTAASFGVRWPVGVSAGVAVLLALGVAVTSEVVSRTSFARRWLPIPSVGAGQPQLDKKLVLLAESVTNGGPVECLFVGSSQVHRAIDPAIVDDAFRTEAGRDLRSFNFGLAGVAETGAGPIARILVSKFRPRLIVVGVSSYGLDDDRGVTIAENLASSPWVRYHHGDFSLDGWLVEHSCALRSYLGYLFWTERRAPANEAVLRRAMADIDATGYGYLDAGAFRKVDKAAARELRHFAVSAAHLESLRDLLRLRSEVEIVVAEIPVHDSVVALFGNGEEDHQRAMDAVQKTAEEQGVLFLRFPADLLIPVDGWSDYVHFNRIGAEVYSRWLGERLAEAVRRGVVKSPAA